MINGKTILAIIPARGGSKGIPRKNIKELAGKPLIAWTIEEAKKSKYIDRLILSSDDEEIITVAKEWGCEVPFVRPKELATDSSPSIDFVLHAINNIDKQFDYICLLQPTSPLRNVDDINNCILYCIDNNSNSCVTISEVEKHPYYMYELSKNNNLIKVLPNTGVLRRQDLPKIYEVNGSVYLNNVDFLKLNKIFIDKSTNGYIIPKERAVDIDSDLDWKICELILKEKLFYKNLGYEK